MKIPRLFSPLPSDPNRAYFIDGMRGWAAVIVVIHHIFYILGDVTPSYHSPYLIFLSDGQLAVRIFFILSGFALSTGYLHTRDTNILAALALRRYPRLTLPILASCILSFIALKTGITYYKEASPFVHNEWWLGTFYKFDPTVGNLFSYALFDVYFRYDTAVPFNPFLWPMPVELYGSLLVFSMLFVAHYVRHRVIIYAAVFIALCLLQNMMLPFIFGVLLAELYEIIRFHSVRRTRIGLAAGLCIMALGIAADTYWRWLLEGTLGFSLVACCVVAGPFLSVHIARFFETSLSRYLGRISFPLYLTHALALATVFSYGIITRTDHGNILTLATSNYLLAVGLASSLWLATCLEPLERFSIKASRKFSDFLMKKS